jgi:hypothetical protein
MKNELRNKPSYMFYTSVSNTLMDTDLREIFLYNENLLVKRDKKIEMLKEYEMQRLKIELN